MSAPSGHRSKTAAAGAAAAPADNGGSAVSTLDRDAGKNDTWSGGGMGGGGSDWGADSWGGVATGGAPDAGASWTGGASAPSAGSSWTGGGGSGWGGAGADSWAGPGGGGAAAPPPPPPAPSAGLAAPSLAPETDSGWTAGAGDSWSGGGGLADVPATERLGAAEKFGVVPSQTQSPGQGGQDQGWLNGGAGDSWTGGGGLGSLGQSEAAPAPAAGAGQDGWSTGGTQDGWGGSALGGGGSPTSAPAAGAPQGGGWLGGGSDPSPARPSGGSSRMPDYDEEEQQEGWLGSGTGAISSKSTTSEAPSNAGWLDGGSASMTEMVDRAIGEEEGDDFVDDSWVDEEIRDGEYDDVALPEYQPPAPEVGGAAVKMLLVAFLVVLVGAGFMYLQRDQKTPEQIAAEELAAARQEARGYVVIGKQKLEEGTPELAVNPLRMGVQQLSEVQIEDAEVDEARVLLATALLENEEYSDAYSEWSALAEDSDQFDQQAKESMAAASKGLRVEANKFLEEAMGYYRDGVSTPVIELGDDALDIYEKHGGNAAQKGRAHGVIGRGYLNGYDYGNALVHLKKAKALNPGGDYSAEFAKIAAETAESRSYSTRRNAPAPPPQRRVIKVNPKIAPSTSYKKNTRPVVRRTHRATNSGNSAPAPAARPQQRKMQEIKAYQRPTQRRSNSGGGRKGSQGVLNTY